MQAAPIDRQVAGRVAGAFLLLVAGVVLFVDHDEFQVRHGRKNGHARAQHDAGMPRVRGQPAFQALCRRHPAVHGDDRLFAKTRLHPFFQLWGQVDLGHHEQGLGLRVGQQHALDRLQIHLGLATACAAKQQEGASLALHLCQHGDLFIRQCMARLDLDCGSLGLLFQAPGQLL